MLKQPKVSIVVPIYGVEKYLHQCVDSILAQTLKDIEIILVDDGSKDKCPEIVDEYAKKDSRIVAVHQPNGGYGRAVNHGIELAKGEYVGIVESDDWIEPTMYEKLYNQITKFNADVCIASFYSYKSESLFPNGTHDNEYMETIDNIDDTKLFSINDFPFLYTVHPSVWSKLYKASFIKNIRFDETPKTFYQDGPFITEIYCKTDKLIGLNDFLYHYRIDNEAASSTNACKDYKLIQILDSWQIAKNILKQYGLFDSLKEEFFFQASKSGLRFYHNIHKQYKKEFFKKWQVFAKEIRDDKTFTYKYFNPQRKNTLQAILNNNYKASIFDEYSSKNFLGIPIIIKYRKDKYRITKILNILKIKKNSDINKYYFLGVKIYEKKIKNIQHFKQFNYEQYFENQQISNLAILKHNYLKRYHNICIDKDIYLIACGPTLNYFKPYSDGIYIGVNRAFTQNNIKFNYLFAQDQFPEGMDDFDNYENNYCEKFYGILSNWHCRRFTHCKRIPINYLNRQNVHTYYLESIISHNWPYDISIEPFGEFKSTIFSALQFALYTNPKRIYIIGCDCSNGYFYGNDSIHKYPHLIEQWQKVHNHLKILYPDIEIISVNPVGLKGLFRDVYTQSYVDEHPELLNENVEILDDERAL